MDTPDFMTSLPDFSERKFLSKRNIITFLIIGILLLAIPVGVKLVQEQQLLKSKATGTEIQFVPDDNVSCDSGGNCATTDPTVQIELRSPLGPPQP